MKNKYLTCIALFLILTSFVQPIFAESNMKPTRLYVTACSYVDTVYYRELVHHEHGFDNEYDVSTGDKFKATAFLSDNDGSLIWRYVDFNLYIVNADGSNGECIFHEQTLTNIIPDGRAVSDEINIPNDKNYPAGMCRLVTTYGGNSRDHLEPCDDVCNLYIN